MSRGGCFEDNTLISTVIYINDVGITIVSIKGYVQPYWMCHSLNCEVL